MNKDINSMSRKELIDLASNLLNEHEFRLNPINKVSVCDIEVDQGEGTASRDGVPLTLTLKEFGLLEHFLRHPNIVINREDLIAHLWDFNYESFSNVVDVHIKNLRRKLDKGAEPSILETIRGIGYRLVV